MLDTKAAKASQLILFDWKELVIVVVGLGGTGSWFAPTAARLTKVLRGQGKTVDLIFCDPDKVEAKNVFRQNFCEAEIGLNKAETLAARYNFAWGLDIAAVPREFSVQQLSLVPKSGRVFLIVGCVDNHEARLAIAKAMSQLQSSASWETNKLKVPGAWWLDSGNYKHGGQVLLGCTSNPDIMKHFSFGLAGAFCAALPLPSVQHPELLEHQAQPKEEAGDRELSCAELMGLGHQSLVINQRMAAELADFLMRFAFRDLRRFATYIDLENGVSQSRYIVPEEVAANVWFPEEKPATWRPGDEEQRNGRSKRLVPLKEAICGSNEYTIASFDEDEFDEDFDED